MNTQSNAMPESPLESQVTAPAPIPATRVLYWSVRRELWENRSVYLAPLAVAAVALFGFSLGSIAGIWEKPLRLNPAQPQVPYDMAAGLMMLTGIVVSVFYCLDALHGERRDRGILFWKSLPVSDLTTVLSKASIPLAVLLLVAFATIVATQLVMLLLSIVVLPRNGLTVAAVWAQLPLVKMWLALPYALAAMALWQAPIYGWLLLVSGWARRAAFLWAVLPLFAIGVIEKVAFNTTHFANLVKYRLFGWVAQALDPQAHSDALMDPLRALAPGRFLSTPGLWIGLAVAVVFLGAAARLRRYRGPI